MKLESVTLQHLLRKRRTIRRELSAVPGLRPIRIAILGGSTTDEVAGLWELLLLEKGFLPVFYQSDFGQFYEEAVLNRHNLSEFAPDLVYIHTSYKNVLNLPPTGATESEFNNSVFLELARYRAIWHALQANLTCQIIQNNFDLPPYQVLGHLDSSAPGGATRFFLTLNLEFAREIATNTRLIVQDLHILSTQIGSQAWFDWNRWFSYKILYTEEANYQISFSLTALVLSIYGMSKKVLVLDLDNTCWGGVIGDDGVEKIQIGRETPVAEAYTAFQQYCLLMRDRGILLAVSSKNEEEVARQGFEHPDSVLKLEHFSSFKANWLPKHENILAIATELNLGVDSLVLVDDNPAERAIVQAHLPSVAVPDIGSDVSLYPAILNAARYFETATLSSEDLERAQHYSQNQQRTAQFAQFENYGEYLDSLEMKAEIQPFSTIYLDRIAQLINKTNQFNLTTKRYTPAEVEALASDPSHICLYGRLLDRFGDNGLISVIVARVDGRDLYVHLWLMSCRVLKRDMEMAMLDALVVAATARACDRIHGDYVPSKKNAIVREHYRALGFTCVADNDPNGTTSWLLDASNYIPRNNHIEVSKG